MKFRFRLSTFFVLVTVSIIAVWWFTTIRPRQLSSSALAELNRLQGQQQVGQLDWCGQMRDLVEIGSSALPTLIHALDETPESDRLNLRTIPYALRCLDDPRAVPALIRAIPRCFGNDGSDMGYSINDQKLMKFLQERHGEAGQTHLSFGRPVNEVFGALEKLTGEDFDHMELAFVISRDSDTARQTSLKRQLFAKSAMRWKTWWESNWHRFTNNPEYARVQLSFKQHPGDEAWIADDHKINESIVRRRSPTHQGMIMEPISAACKQLCFLDLDTKRQAILPERFHELEFDDSMPAEVFDWAKAEGFDLYGSTLQQADESQHVIKAIDLQLFEVLKRTDGTPWTVALARSRGREVGTVIAHFDSSRDELDHISMADFLFITNQNTVGLISLGVQVKSVVKPNGRVGRNLNEKSTGRILGRRFAITYLPPCSTN